MTIINILKSNQKMEDVKPSSGESEFNIKSKTDVALCCATMSGRAGMDGSPFSGANEKIEKIQLEKYNCSLSVFWFNQYQEPSSNCLTS